MSRCPSPECWGPSDCAHDEPPYSWALRGLPDKARAKALAELRPRRSHGYDQAGWHLTALPEQWTRGVNADEWIEYVPEPRGSIPGWPQPTEATIAKSGPCRCGHSREMHWPQTGFPHWGCTHKACWCEAYDPK